MCGMVTRNTEILLQVGLSVPEKGTVNLIGRMVVLLLFVTVFASSSSLKEVAQSHRLVGLNRV